MKEHFFIYNDEYFRVGAPVITAQNRSFRYGDGLFETMRIYNNKIINADFHFERLFSGMEILEYEIPPHFSSSYFTSAVNQLLLKNSIFNYAKARLMVFRGNEEIFEIENNSSNYIIEAFPFSEKLELNEIGLELDIFPHSKESISRFSNLKSNNYLLSVMAARFAKQNKLDDAIILNDFGRICESSVANIFIIKGAEIFTPPLSEGCVAGTLRRWLLEKLESKSYTVVERPLTEDVLLNADEFFITNSLHLLKWVKKFKNKTYANSRVKEVFKEITENI